MRFKFKAKDKKNKMQNGVVDAISKELAVQILQENNLNPILVERETGDSSLIQYLHKSWEKVGKKDLLVFFRQFHALISSKVPVVYSLRAIGDQTEHKYLSSLIKDIANDVEDGTTFSEALGRYPDVFPKVITSVVNAGEISGNLDESIKHVAESTEKNYRITAKIRGALIYPAFILTAALVVGFLSVVIIVPKLTLIIKDLNADVPWYTHMVIYIGDFMQAYWWAVLVVIIGFITAVAYYVKTEAGRKEWDKIQLELPIIGKLFQYLYLTKFANNFVVILDGGVPIVQSLNIVAEVVNNSIYRGIILRCADEVKTGGNISTVLVQSDYIPGIVTKMVMVGEKTGKISESLASVGNFYEQEMDEMIKNLSVLIEPVLIVGLGLGVAFLAFSIILPIYNVVQNF